MLSPIVIYHHHQLLMATALTTKRVALVITLVCVFHWIMIGCTRYGICGMEYLVWNITCVIINSLRLNHLKVHGQLRSQ